MRHIVVAGLLLLALAGCSSATPAPSEPAAGSAGAATTAAPFVQPVKLGDTYTYTDNVSVTVSQGASFDPRPYYQNQRGLTFTVKVVNGSGEPLAVSSIGNGPKVTADGADPSLIVNPRNPKAGAGSYDATILPGKSYTYYSSIGLDSAAKSDLQVEWVRDRMSPPAIFTGEG